MSRSRFARNSPWLFVTFSYFDLRPDMEGMGSL
jgi:hypothetical protein